MYLGCQFFNFEWFGKKVIGVGIEFFDDVFGFVCGGEYQNWDGKVQFLMDVFVDFLFIDFGEDDIENDEVKCFS